MTKEPVPRTEDCPPDATHLWGGAFYKRDSMNPGAVMWWEHEWRKSINSWAKVIECAAPLDPASPSAAPNPWRPMTERPTRAAMCRLLGGIVGCDWSWFDGKRFNGGWISHELATCHQSWYRDKGGEGAVIYAAGWRYADESDSEPKDAHACIMPSDKPGLRDDPQPTPAAPHMVSLPRSGDGLLTVWNPDRRA